MGRKLEIDDLGKFPMVSSPKLSPDRKTLLYVVTRIENESYNPMIYLCDATDGLEKRAWEGGRSPEWSPDGSRILFVSNKGLKEGEKGAALWVTSPTGDPRMICKSIGGIEQPMWRRDSQSIFFLSYVGEEEKDVYVIDRLPFRFDAIGWTNYRRKHLHMVDLASGIIKQITTGDLDLVCYSPSNVLDKIAYVTTEHELNPRENDLHVLDLKTDKCIKILSGYSISTINWSPDDTKICFMGNDLSYGYPTHSTVWVIPVSGEEPTNLTSQLDRGSTRVVYNDIRSPNSGPLNPVWDGNWIYFPVSDGGKINLHKINPESKEIKPILTGDFVVDEFNVKGNMIAYLKTTIKDPMEVWIKNELKDIKITRLTEFTTSEIPLVDGEKFEFTASDGVTIEGWLLKPFDWRPGGKYPAIFDIHGGPRSKFGYATMFDHQMFASEGFAVVIGNIRGSDGYDQEFADIRFKYGTRDYQDLLEMVDHVLKVNKWIDPEKLGVTGLSYGGFMTNWVIGHTSMFRCAVSQNSISSWESFFGTSDIGFHFSTDQIGGDPWSNHGGYIEKSPITYAQRVTTPTLFIHSYNDYRCWIDQSILMYNALRYLGKKAKLIIYKEGSHSFRNLAPTSTRKRRLSDMVSWFNEYLKQS